MKKKYPQQICLLCGIKHGLRSVYKPTWEEGSCEICKEACQVTSPAAFGHLRGNWEIGNTNSESATVHRSFIPADQRNKALKRPRHTPKTNEDRL